MLRERCPECQTEWAEGKTCTDHFSQMLAWENEEPALGEVHHLMVLSYYLQHPSLYSPDGLQFSKGLLVDFVARGITPQEVRRRDRDKVDSGKRKFKVTARPGFEGSYAHPVQWTITAADVVAAGKEQYRERVRAWAQSVFEGLRAAGELPDQA